MEIPKFLTAENTDHPNDNFVIHTQFPRFIINLINDEIEWLEEFDNQDREEEETLTKMTAELIDEATLFFDREMERYSE